MVREAGTGRIRPGLTRAGTQNGGSSLNSPLGLASPFLAARWGNATFGAAGATTATALAGLVDVHAPSMAVAQMASRAQLEPRTALVAIAGAMASNAMIKGVMAFGAGGFPFGMRFAALLLPAVAAFAAGLWVSLP